MCQSDDLFAFSQKRYMHNYQVKHRERLSAYHIEYRNKNRAKLISNGRKYQETAYGRANVLIQAAKKRAKKKNEVFNLTTADILPAIEHGKCQRTGVKFNLTMGIRLLHGKGMHPRSPSIDKIDPFGMYEPGNVQIVCAWYNMAKAQMTDNEMLELCRITVEHNR